MRRVLFYALLLILGAGLSVVIFHDSAKSAGPPSALSVQEVNTDAGGNIRVHEQGTATVTLANPTVTISNLPSTQTIDGTVTVTNFPGTQNVNGTVTVGNLPLDSSGNLKVAGSVAHGRTVRAFSETPINGHVGLDSSSSDFSDCRAVEAFVRSDFSPEVLLRIDVGGADFGAATGTRLGASDIWVFAAQGVPVVAPRAALRIVNNDDSAHTINEAWLYCSP